ncbi:MAG: ABC transporter ATP-binding protein [Lachnospiraceae bacterium]|nr:ABC transporter ATP-binding protein [Lachnospiraceae bacterium]
MENNKKNTKKTYNVFAVIKRLMTHMWKQDKAQYGRMAVYTVIGALQPFLAVFLPKLAIGILEQGGEDAIRNLMIAMAGYFVAAGVIVTAVRYLSAYISTRNMRMRLNYLGQLADRLQTMDYCHHENAGFFEEYQKGMNAGNGNANGIEGMYNKLTTIGASFLTLIGMVLMAGALSPVLLISLVVHVAVILWTSKLTHDYEYSKKEETSKAWRRIGYYERTTLDFSYGKDIRIFNLRNRIMDNYQAEINAFVKLFAGIKNKEFLLGLCGIVTLLISNVLTYGILVQEVINGMPVSSFTMYTAMVVSLMSLMLAFGKDLAFIWNEGEYVNDFYRLLDAPLVVEGERTAAEVFDTTKVESGHKTLKQEKTLEIVFDHVTFRYPGTEKNIFTDLNFTIHSGERLAIVGINGAGKSTLVKLMTGLFAPTEGKIYVNGVDITTLKKNELYSLYSAVFQEVNVLAFTIWENVACASENVDDERVKTALDKVGLWNKVEHFENGLDQMMLKVIDENGTDFSGGERQKLSIARGLYKDAAMVIMDEPTAALDALAEAEIYENFSSLVEGKTAVYISHRLASTRFCDKIALFDADGLAEYGNHEELMEQKGKYYEMFMIQGKYYQEENAEEAAAGKEMA